jgi:hypothetical protein
LVRDDILEDRGRSFAERALGADPHPDRCRVVILEEANQLPALLVERVVEPDVFVSDEIFI